MRKILTLSLIATMAGTAMGQAAPNTALPDAPMAMAMPSEVTMLGDPDAACLIASADLVAMTANLTEGTPDDRQNMQNIAHEQVGFFAGRLSRRFAQASAQDQSSKVVLKWFAPDSKLDKRPVMKWCLRASQTQIGAFSTNLAAAYKIADDMAARGRGPVKPEDLDPDTLCIALIGVALPGTAERAKQDPNAQRGVDLLRRSQTYYMGRILAADSKTPIANALAESLLYLGQLMKAKDEATAYTKVGACTDQYTSTRIAFFQSMAKALAPLNPQAKPK